MSFSGEIGRKPDKWLARIDSMRNDDAQNSSSEYVSCNEEFDIVAASEMRNCENVQEVTNNNELQIDQVTPDLAGCTCYFFRNIDISTDVAITAPEKKFTFEANVVDEPSAVMSKLENLNIGSAGSSSKSPKVKRSNVGHVEDIQLTSPRRSSRNHKPSSRYSNDFIVWTPNRMKSPTARRKSFDFSSKTPQQQNSITPNRKRKSDTFIEKPGRGPKSPKLFSNEEQNNRSSGRRQSNKSD